MVAEIQVVDQVFRWDIAQNSIGWEAYIASQRRHHVIVDPNQFFLFPFNNVILFEIFAVICAHSKIAVLIVVCQWVEFLPYEIDIFWLHNALAYIEFCPRLDRDLRIVNGLALCGNLYQSGDGIERLSPRVDERWSFLRAAHIAVAGVSRQLSHRRIELNLGLALRRCGFEV